MKFFLTVITAILILTPAYAEEDKRSSDCWDKARSQYDLYSCAEQDYQDADAELNRVYQMIQQVYKDDPLFLEKLKIAQRAWIKFRDAAFDMKYPHNDDHFYYGSVFPMCSASYLTKITETRIKQLKIWLKGVPEGEMCGGSVKKTEVVKELKKN